LSNILGRIGVDGAGRETRERIRSPIARRGLRDSCRTLPKGRRRLTRRATRIASGRLPQAERAPRRQSRASAVVAVVARGSFVTTCRGSSVGVSKYLKCDSRILACRHPSPDRPIRSDWRPKSCPPTSSIILCRGLTDRR